MSASTLTERATEARDTERAWLVFRLGTHVMCASALDVEGIIARPATIASLPFAPKYVLGTFLFRDQTATAVSLRRKLGVRDGEDSALGPFIAVRVRDAVVAFWVDEVKDVIEERDVAWQPMPEPLDGGFFDKYTLRTGELILHTSFAALLAAQGGLEAVGRWASNEAEVRQPDAPIVPPPHAASASAPIDQAIAAACAAPEEAPSTPPRPDGTSPHAAVGTAAAHRRPPQRPAAADQVSPRTRGTPIERATLKRSAALPCASAPPVHSAPARPIDDLTHAQMRARGVASPAVARPGRAALHWGAIGFAVALAAIGAYVLVPGDAPRPRADAARLAQRAEPRPSVSPPVAATKEAFPVAQPPAATARGEDGTAAPQTVTIEAETFRMTIERAPRADARGDAPSAVPRASQAAADTRVHVVVRGDTLWEIARKHLGDPYRYPELVRHSGIRNPDLIHPGDVVRIELRGARR